MTDRYIFKPIDLGYGVTAWHVLDSRVIGGGEPAFVARCGNEDDARLVRDALNGPAIVEAFLKHWLRERMQAGDALIAIAIGDFREWWARRARG